MAWPDWLWPPLRTLRQIYANASSSTLRTAELPERWDGRSSGKHRGERRLRRAARRPSWRLRRPRRAPPSRGEAASRRRSTWETRRRGFASRAGDTTPRRFRDLRAPRSSRRSRQRNRSQSTGDIVKRSELLYIS